MTIDFEFCYRLDQIGLDLHSYPITNPLRWGVPWWCTRSNWSTLPT